MVTEDRPAAARPRLPAITDEADDWSVGALSGAFYRVYCYAPQHRPGLNRPPCVTYGPKVERPRGSARGNQIPCDALALLSVWL
jgi:hypothetical protein